MDKRTKLYNELLDSSKSRILDNISTHKLRTARIKAGHTRLRSLEAKTLPKLPLDFLAIGDSWFEYPLYDNGTTPPFFEETGIVARVQLGSMGTPPPQILNQALHGQATTAMLSWENQERLISLLEDPSQWLNQTTKLPDAILVSAGGDDVVGDQLAIYLAYDGTGLTNRYQGALDSVQASYADLFAFRDRYAKGVPIIGHCYDYAIPNGVVPVCIQTAWLQPSFQFMGYDYDRSAEIVVEMIDKFHDMLAKLAAVPANNFALINTRGILQRDATSATGWANEIHPRFAGFTALAQKFLTELQAKFSGRI